MEQEAAQELLRTERHHSLLISVGIILPAKSNLVMLESHEAMVGDGYAVTVQAVRLGNSVAARR